MRARAALGLVWLAGVACFGYVRRTGPVVPSDQAIRVRTAAPESLTVRAGDSAWTVRGVTEVYGTVLHVAGDTLDMLLAQLGQSGRLVGVPAGARASVVLAPGSRVEAHGFDLGGTAKLFGLTIVAGAAALVVLLVIFVRALSKT